MKTKNYIKNIVCGALCLVFVFGFASTAAAAVDTNFDYSNLNYDKSSTEYGAVGGAFDIAGKAIGNTMTGLFGNLSDSPNNDVTSFIDFKGGLTPPSATSGLDTTLTKAQTARQFILNVVNFALSFLGILAVVIVIYGGFLYVSSAGNEEQSGKGKKAIEYAVIGILIIIGSFALVNTLLTFGGGSESDRNNIRGSAQEGSNVGQQAIYNLGAQRIIQALNDFARGYRNRVATQDILSKISALPTPSTLGENRQYLNAVKSYLSEITNNTDSLSKTYLAAKTINDGWVARNLVNVPEASANLPVALKTELEKADTNIDQAAQTDFNTLLDDLNGANDGENGGVINNIRNALGDDIANLPASATIENAKQRGIISDKDLSRAFEGIDPNTTVSSIFNELKNNLKKSRALGTQPTQTTLVINTVKSFQTLYLVVKDIQFVFVRIKTPSMESNAPYVVELNGLDSRDPTGQTIPDDMYKWDPDGDGEDDIKAGGVAPVVTCNNVTGPIITCTYNKPGTYIVGLSIKSQDPGHIAPGQAFLAITVKPSIARINLKAKIGSTLTDIEKYAQDSSGKWYAAVDKNELQVTTQEAQQNGVSYDASESKGGDGQNLTSYNWTFGDSTQAESGPDKNKIDGHKYAKSGQYTLTLEVTDTGKRKDKKIVTVVVASLAARIETQAQIGSPDELLEFDGSASRSDNGAVSIYTWSILNKTGNDVINSPDTVSIVGDKGKAVLRTRFKKPGTYAVHLKVSDNTNTAETEVVVGIKSKKPHANFSINACPDNCPDPTQPNVVELDGSTSFDPEPSNVLTYKWQFYSDAGDSISTPSGISAVSGSLEGKDEAKKVRVKFLKRGIYKIQLLVNNSLPDPEIIQDDMRDKMVSISSVVETAWDPTLATAQQLKDNEASFVLSGRVVNASTVKIEYGDGNVDQLEVKSAGDTFSFNHKYNAAKRYVVTLTATSDTGDRNVITKALYVSSGDTPLPVIKASLNNVPVDLLDDTTPLEVMRNKAIAFDGTASLNSAGTAQGLKYSWDFGDGSKSTNSKVLHSYTDLSEATPYKVTLTVTEQADATKHAETTFLVSVVGKKPVVSALSIEKQTAGNVTPVDVVVTTEGASDPDGKIMNYQFWYFDTLDRETKRSVVDTQSNRAVLTIETNGEADEEHEYYFCVSVTDSDGNTVECKDLFDENALPRLKVTNGANKPPEAIFTADRTTIKVGQAVTFNSASKDEDGRIASYIWDVEGDGFQNNQPTQLTTITHTYARKNPAGGYRVKLKVIDDKGAAGYSKEVPIFADTNSTPPTANFNYQVLTSPTRRVRFFDTSVAHGTKITKWTWDFDTTQEFTMKNSDPADDTDSTDQNPVFDYPNSGSHMVKLTVEDADGNVATPRTALINVVSGSSGGSDATTPAAGGAVKAELRTEPSYQIVPDPADPSKKIKEIHIGSDATGTPINGQNVKFFYGESSTDTTNKDHFSYRLDKNLFCDSNGDGDRTNDTDNVKHPTGSACTTEGSYCWETNYQRYAKTAYQDPTTRKVVPGHFRLQFTVTDVTKTTGLNTASDTVDIVFDGNNDITKMATNGCDIIADNNLGASLFKKLGIQNTILLGLLSGVIVVLIAYTASVFFTRSTRRNN